MKFRNLTSFYLLILLILITTAATALDLLQVAGNTMEGNTNKHKEGKCHGARCSPPLRGRTKAILTINSFQKGGDGGGASECDGRYHSDDTLIVALSTGCYSNGALCHRNITIYANNGRSTKAMVVDECDVRHGCPRNIVDGSRAVWKALGVPKRNPGRMLVAWSR